MREVLRRYGSPGSALLLGAAGLSIFIGIWAAAAANLNNEVLLPSPLSVLNTYAELLADGSLLGDVRASIVRVFRWLLHCVEHRGAAGIDPSVPRAYCAASSCR